MKFCIGEKFHFSNENIETLILFIQQLGIEVFPRSTGEILIDMDDLIFYEVAVEMQMKNAFLVTGNLKHYPSEHFIITPAQMIELLNTSEEVG